MTLSKSIMGQEVPRERMERIIQDTYNQMTARGWYVIEATGTNFSEISTEPASGIEMGKTYVICAKMRKADLVPGKKIMLQSPTIKINGQKVPLPSIEANPMGIWVKSPGRLGLMFDYTDFEESLKTLNSAPGKPTYSRAEKKG